MGMNRGAGVDGQGGFLHSRWYSDGLAGVLMLNSLPCSRTERCELHLRHKRDRVTFACRRIITGLECNVYTEKCVWLASKANRLGVIPVLFCTVSDGPRATRDVAPSDDMEYSPCSPSV